MNAFLLNGQYPRNCEYWLSFDAALMLTALALLVFTLVSYGYVVPNDVKRPIFRHVLWGLSMTVVIATVFGLLISGYSLC